MSEYYAVQRSGDHLTHYGVKGMKWGVRRALAYGNDKALDRHFRKAAKKLSTLQDIGLNSKKYAVKSAAYGAAAAGTGTLAVKGLNFKLRLPGMRSVKVTAPKGTEYVSKVANSIDFRAPKARIGLGVVAAGLAAKSAQNAYRAKNAPKYREKAYEMKNAMDEVFSGTKYEGRYVAEPRRRRKRG